MILVREKKIFYSQNNCNPFVRNILKSVFLVDNVKLTFIKDKRTSKILSQQRKNWEKLIDRISYFDQTEQVLKDSILINELKKLVRHKAQVENSLYIIKEYLYTMNKEVKSNRIIERWIHLYGEKKQFLFKEGMKVNSVNYKETFTYLKLFKIQKESMQHMENATATLLETIPCDVDNIADIGAGPGLVNQYIPYYYDVLAMDINQEILAQNSRKTCIGDILDIPLQNQSVDMTITCDVLEHLEPDKLDKAVSELRRVSKKYIYIQVPHDEILRYSVARCPECGNIWHVNFHKNRFTLETLKQYENEEWKIIQVNYTGNVDNELESRVIYDKIEKEKLDIYRVENFECPKCGTKSKTLNMDMLTGMIREDNIQADSKKIMPKYTEIAVLYEKKSKKQERKVEEEKRDEVLNEKHLYSNTEINFTKRFMCKNVYTGKEQVPSFFKGSSEIEITEKGLIVAEKDNSWIGIALPYIIAGDELEIEGSGRADTRIIIVGIDKNEQEFKEVQIDSEGGDFIYKHKMSSKWKDHSTFLKLYFNKEIILSAIRVHRKEKRNYYFLKQSDVNGDHCIFIHDNILYRYYIPEEGVAFEQNGSGIIEVG